MNKIEIKAWLDSMNIVNYTINDNLVVDSNSDVDISFKKLILIPVQFGKVNGGFYCDFNQLTSLAGCPSSVGGDFWCTRNQLTSLAGCPSSVGDGFWCDHNQLISLAGCPSSVGGDFICDGYLKNNIEYKRYEVMKKVQQLA